MFGTDQDACTALHCTWGSWSSILCRCFLSTVSALTGPQCVVRDQHPVLCTAESECCDDYSTSSTCVCDRY